MAKVLSRVLTFAAAIVVNVVPGLGQLASAAILVGVGLASAALNSLGNDNGKPESSKRAIRQPIPPSVRAYGRSRQFGALVLYETASDGSTVDVIAFCDGPATAIEQYYLNDQRVTVTDGVVQALPDKSYQGGNVLVGVNLGQATETAHAPVVAKLPGIWTSAHRGDGVVSGYLIKKAEKSKYFLETYPQGDNVSESVVGQWLKCFDPRTGLAGWTENPVLHLLDYLTTQRNVDYTRQILPRLSHWINAANICDEQIPLAGGGTEPRYRSSVSYERSPNVEPKTVLAAFLDTFDGFIARMGDGSIVVYAGKGYEPTVSIGPDDIVGYTLIDGQRDENAVDKLNVTYISAEHDYQVVECDPWGGDEGSRRATGFGPQTTSYSQNRRLAKRRFAQLNPILSGSVQCNLGGRRARGERYINLLIEEGGMTFFDGVAEIVGFERDLVNGGVTIEWIAYDANVDEWNPETEQGQPAALGDRVARQPLDAPVITSATAIFEPATDGGTGVRLRVTVPSTGRADEQWFLRWRIDGASVWNEDEYPDTDPGAAIELDSGFVPANSDIEVQVAYGLGDGRISPFSLSEIVDTNTYATPPGAAPAPVLDSWGAALVMSVGAIERASSYRWRIYASDGTTLIRTMTTMGRTLVYDNALATADGILRNYVIDVAGVNAAGVGAVGVSGPLSNPAPAALTGFTATGGSTDALIEFSALGSPPADFVGYAIFYSDTSGFDPATQGQVIYTFATSTPIYGLSAGTYYAIAAAYDSWSNRPGSLNLTAQQSFVITTGNGGAGGGGGGGGLVGVFDP